jgi:acyl carrier protein
MKREEIFKRVTECLIEVLGVEADSITEEAKIIDDLGADSLDLLEITFVLQQMFGIAISPRDIERRAKEKLGGKPLEVDGVYTPEALAQLRSAMPEIPAEELADGLQVAELPRKLRVATLINMVWRLLEEKGE